MPEIYFTTQVDPKRRGQRAFVRRSDALSVATPDLQPLHDPFTIVLPADLELYDDERIETELSANMVVGDNIQPDVTIDDALVVYEDVGTSASISTAVDISTP